MYGVVDFLGDGGEKPIYFLFVGGWFEGVVVCHHATYAFKFVYGLVMFVP